MRRAMSAELIDHSLAERSRHDRLVEDEGARIRPHGVLAAGFRSQMALQAWVTLGQLFEGDGVGDARMSDADGSFRSPGRLEFHSGSGPWILNPEAVIEVDQRAVPRAWAVVSPVIGTKQMDAGLEEVAHRH